MYGRQYHNKCYRMALFLVSFCFSALSYAQPDMQPLGPNIADKGSGYYHFRSMTFNLLMAQDITGYGPLFPIKPPRRRVILSYICWTATQ